MAHDRRIRTEGKGRWCRRAEAKMDSKKERRQQDKKACRVEPDIEEGKKKICVGCQHLIVKIARPPATVDDHLGCQMKLLPEWKGGWGCRHQKLVEPLEIAKGYKSFDK